MTCQACVSPLSSRCGRRAGLGEISLDSPTVQAARKTYQYKLRPTPEQERALEAVLWRCRVLYITVLKQRLTWWRRGQGQRATRFQQEAELKELRASLPSVRGAPQPRAAGCARPPRPHRPGLLPTRAGRREVGVPAACALPFLHLQRVWQRRGWTTDAWSWSRLGGQPRAELDHSRGRSRRSRFLAKRLAGTPPSRVPTCRYSPFHPFHSLDARRTSMWA